MGEGNIPLNVLQESIKQAAWSWHGSRMSLWVPLKHLPSEAFPHAADSLNHRALCAAFQPLQSDFCTPQSAAGMLEEILPTWGGRKGEHNPSQSYAPTTQHRWAHTQLIHLSNVTSMNWQPGILITMGDFPRDQYYIKQGLVKYMVLFISLLRW